jgi:Fic family protein
MELLHELPFCLRLIRALHEVLLSGVRGRDKAPGEFRRVQVHIGSDFRYLPPPPNHLQDCLTAFERALHVEDHGVDPLVQCYLLHYQFEAIHPFLDGNGRVGRVLLSLMIFARCNLFMPWLYLSAYFERYRDEYIDGLFKVSTDGDWTNWVRLCVRATTAQAKDSIQRCDALKRLKEEFHMRINQAGTTKAGVRAHQIVEELFNSPMLSVPDNARRWNISYPTSKSDVSKLMSLGILMELKGHHPALFVSAPILKVAFSDA